MSKITDYAFLFKSGGGMGIKSNMVKMSDLNSPSVQAQMKAAGIDTNSAQYKTVIKDMKAAGRGGGYFSISGIKNRMQHYDSDGDWINPRTGLSGLVVTDKNRAQKNKIIDIPDSSKQEMFELTKKEFLRENGVGNGDTTKRGDVYTNLYRKMKKNDRLAAGNSLRQYERAYTQAFVDAALAADPKWEPGKPIKAGALDGVTRESVDAALAQTGGRFVGRTSVNYKV